MNYLFNKCVDLLYYLATMFSMSYEEINVILFCIVWPMITLFLIYKAYFSGKVSKK